MKTITTIYISGERTKVALVATTRARKRHYPKVESHERLDGHWPPDRHIARAEGRSVIECPKERSFGKANTK
jgi:hypothetical protein